MGHVWYCTVCSKFESQVDKTGPFFKGRSSFQKTLQERHNRSQQHLASVVPKRAANNPSSRASLLLVQNMTGEANLIITAYRTRVIAPQPKKGIDTGVQHHANMAR